MVDCVRANCGTAFQAVLFFGIRLRYELFFVLSFFVRWAI